MLHPEQPPQHYEAWAFGGDPDGLLALVLSGVKTGTSSAYALYETQAEPLPQEGDYSIVLNAKGEAACILQTTKLYVCPFDQVSADHAHKEGEGDKSLAHWRAVHEAFFRDISMPFTPDMPVLCEEFTVVYPR